jgi:SOS-response transcriptional repressor LexA
MEDTIAILGSSTQRRVLCARAECGTPSGTEQWDDAAEVPEFLLRETDYVIRAHGRSMEPTVCEGFLLIVEGGARWREGSLVVAHVLGVGLVLKRFCHGSLCNDNPLFPAVFSVDEAEIVGVVRHIIITVLV